MYQAPFAYNNTAMAFNQDRAVKLNGARNANDDGAAYGSGPNYMKAYSGGAGSAAAGGSMYGRYGSYGNGMGMGNNGSMYGMNGPSYGSNIGSLMMDEEIIVTKLFTSRRDLDRLASGMDFPRRFDSYWGSYRSQGDNSEGSGFRNTQGSLMDFEEGPPEASNADGVGAGGAGADGEVKDNVKLQRLRSEMADIPREEELRRKRQEEAQKAREDALVRSKEKQDEENRSAEKEAKERTVAAEKELGEKERKQREEAEKLRKRKENQQRETQAARLKAEEEARRLREEQLLERKRAEEAEAARLQKQQLGKKNNAVRDLNPDDIPLLREDVEPKPVKKVQQYVAVELPPPPQQEVEELPHTQRPGSRRPNSRRPSRPLSRALSILDVEIPQATEIMEKPDEVVPEATTEQQQEHAAKLAERHKKQKAAQEEASRLRAEEARQRRMEREAEECAKQKAIADMDAAKRREREDMLAARERQREEEKQRLEAERRAEEEAEAARVKSIMEKRQQQLQKDADEKSEVPRTASRPRSRHRPASRPLASLRGAIPEQPPDVEAGQVTDTMADGLSHLQDGTNAPARPARTNRNRSRSPGDSPARESAASPVVTATAVPVHREPTPKQPTPRATPKSIPPPEQQLQQTAPIQRSGGTPALPSDNQTVNRYLEEPPRRSDDAPTRASMASSNFQQENGVVKPPEVNMCNTLVLVEKINKGNKIITHTPTSITYNGVEHPVTELKEREEGSFSYQSAIVSDVRVAVCNGYNAAVISNEAPNTASRFDSPVWPILNRVVRMLLQENTLADGQLNPDFEITCGLGYVCNDKAKDLLADESSFQTLTVHPSPIYGPRIGQLQYGKIFSASAFEEALSNALMRAGNDTVLSTLTEGIIMACVVVKQIRIVDGEKDVFLSSFIVASAGTDTAPYKAGIERARTDYGALFHLVLGGPCFACYMLNVADDDTLKVSPSMNGASTSDELQKLFGLLDRMTALKNYQLRSGSVKRFCKFIRQSLVKAEVRATSDPDPEARRKYQRFIDEQKRLLAGARQLLADAGVTTDEEL